MHMDMSQEAFCARINGENSGRFRYHLDWTPGLNCYRNNPSVWPHCLGNKTRWKPPTRMHATFCPWTVMLDSLALHSCGTHSCLTLFGDTLAWQSYGTLSLHTLWRHSCLTLFGDTLAWHSCGTLLLDTLSGLQSCTRFVSSTNIGFWLVSAWLLTGFWLSVAAERFLTGFWLSVAEACLTRGFWLVSDSAS